jgi:hypothetical protein
MVPFILVDCLVQAVNIWKDSVNLRKFVRLDTSCDVSVVIGVGRCILLPHASHSHFLWIKINFVDPFTLLSLHCTVRIYKWRSLSWFSLLAD